MDLSADGCFFEDRNEHGYIWSYTHTPDEPGETLHAALAMAISVAGSLAVKEGKTYVIASTAVPLPTIFILPFGHPMIVERALQIMNHMLPDGRRVRGAKSSKHNDRRPPRTS